MKTKDEILEDFRKEIELKYENDLKTQKFQQENKLRKKWLKYFSAGIMIYAIIYLTSVIGINSIKPDITMVFVVCGGIVWILLTFVFVFFFMERLMNRYVKKRLILCIEPLKLDEEVKELIKQELEKLPKEISDLQLEVESVKNRLTLLLEIQKEI